MSKASSPELRGCKGVPCFSVGMSERADRATLNQMAGGAMAVGI